MLIMTSEFIYAPILGLAQLAIPLPAHSEKSSYKKPEGTKKSSFLQAIIISSLFLVLFILILNLKVKKRVEPRPSNKGKYNTCKP